MPTLTTEQVTELLSTIREFVNADTAPDQIARRAFMILDGAVESLEALAKLRDMISDYLDQFEEGEN